MPRVHRFFVASDLVPGVVELQTFFRREEEVCGDLFVYIGRRVLALSSVVPSAVLPLARPEASGQVSVKR